MRIIDGHSDILTDVTIKRQQGQKNIFKRDHLNKLKKGNIEGIVFVVWIDPPYTNDPTWRMLEILGATCEEIDDMKDCSGIVYKFTDMFEIQKSGKLPIILGMEGLSGLKGNVSLINLLYKLGIRHASLTWNEENEFATGVASPHTDRGLTVQGINAIKRMEELGIIVDVSHANEKTFWDIYENTHKPFIASHSNAFGVYSIPRNLKDTQIKAIAERGGIIGINALPDLINKDNPNIENLVRHIDYITDLVGVDNIAFGFDFNDFLEGNFQGTGPVSAQGIEDASKVPALVDYLLKKGYKTDEVEKIAYGNFARVIKSIIKE